MAAKRNHVFISHNSMDKSKIDKLIKALQTKGFEVWYDVNDIKAGESWEEQVRDELLVSKICVVFFSDAGWGPHHKREVEIALGIPGIKIIPALLPGAPSNKVDLAREFYEPSRLSDRNIYLDFRGEFNIQNALSMLEKAILGEGKGLDWSVKLERDAQNWERGRQSTYSGSVLKKARDWATDNQSDISKSGLKFINASITAQNNRLWLIIGGLVGIIGIITLLAMYAVTQRNVAISRETARATAQAIAEEQRDIALSQILTAKAKSLLEADDSSQMIALLLAIQSLKLEPSSDATEILQTNSHASQVFQLNHASSVMFVAYSPDGKHIVSGSWDETVRVWDASSGEEVCRIILTGIPNAVVVSPSGKYIAVGDNARMLRVAETSTCREISHMEHEHTVTSISFSPDEKLIASNGVGEIAHVWETATGYEVSKRSSSMFEEVSFSPDGFFVITGNQMWNPSTGEAMGRIPGTVIIGSQTVSSDEKYIAASDSNGNIHILEIGKTYNNVSPQSAKLVGLLSLEDDLQSVTALFADEERGVVGEIGLQEIATIRTGSQISIFAISPQGNYLATGSSDHTVRLWDITKGSEIYRMTHDGVITDISFSPDGKFIASGSADGAIILWGIPTQDGLINELNSHQYLTVSFSPSRNLVAGVEGQAIRVWSQSPWRKINNFSQTPEPNRILFDPKGKIVITETEAHLIRVWDMASGNLISEFAVENDEGLTYSHVPLVISPDGIHGISASGNIVYVWDILEGKELYNIKHEESYNGTIYSLAFSPDGEYAILGSEDKSAMIWNVHTKGKVARLRDKSNKSSIFFVGFGPDNYHAVTMALDGKITIWDTQKKAIISSYQIENANIAAITSLARSIDGKYLAIGDGNFGIILDLTDGSIVCKLNNISMIYQFSFTTNNEYILTLDSNNMVGIWEMTTGKELSRKSLGENTIYAAIDPNGKFILTQGYGEGVKAWLWRPEDLILEVCSRIPRNLTNAEWQKYIGDALPYQAVCSNLGMEQ